MLGDIYYPKPGYKEMVLLIYSASSNLLNGCVSGVILGCIGLVGSMFFWMSSCRACILVRGLSHQRKGSFHDGSIVRSGFPGQVTFHV